MAIRSRRALVFFGLSALACTSETSVPVGSRGDRVVSEVCRRLELEASTKPGKGGALTRQFFTPFSFLLPSEVQTIEGDNGNHRLVLTFSARGGVAVRCEWRPGKGGKSPPKGEAKEKSYAFSACDNGAMSGSIAEGDTFALELQAGAGHAETTVRMPLVEATPCATDAWLAARPHYSRFDPALSESVVFVTDVDKYVLRAGGVLQTPEAFRTEADHADRLQFGALEASLAAEIAIPPPQGQVPPPRRVAVYFDVAIDWTDLTQRLASTSSSMQEAARADLDLAITKAGATMRTAVIAAGMTDVTTAVGIPAVFGTATRETLAALANNSSIVFIQSDEPGLPRSLAEPLNITSDAHIDTAFNGRTPPVFGEGQAVGVYEARAPGCTFYQAHRAFEFATKVDSAEPRMCSNDIECDICNEGSIFTPASRNTFCLDIGGGRGKRCVQRHISQTLSAISASVGGASMSVPATPFAAARSTLVNFNDTGNNCSDERFDLAFNFYLKRGATTTYESFDCPRIVGRGTTQDFYARYKNMLVLRAASNSVSDFACKEVHNGLCVGGSTPEGGVWSTTGDVGSTFLNPPGTDREEPDVMALGTKATTAWVDTFDAAKSSTPNVYQTNVSGTSIATPIVAAMGMLTKQACAAPNLDQRLVRAMTMVSAWSRNADGWLYSTPGVSSGGSIFDHKDGAGIAMAENLARFCDPPGTPDPNGPKISRGTSLVDLVGTPRFPSNFGLFSADRPPGGTGAGDPGSAPAPTKSKVSANLLGARYWSARLNPGQRVRTTFAWDSCVSKKSNRVTTDFDVYLCNEDPPAFGAPPIPYCYFASRSFDDNNEGMDVTVDKAGLWSLWYVFPGPREIEFDFKPLKTILLSSTCNGATVEPVAWAVAWF